jgi:hypothetical protein
MLPAWFSSFTFEPDYGEIELAWPNRTGIVAASGRSTAEHFNVTKGNWRGYA